MAFADPDCPHVPERDTLEQIGGTLPGRIRNALNFRDPLRHVLGVDIGLHTVHLHNSVFRFDNEIIVTPHRYRARGYQHPAMHLRELAPHGIFGPMPTSSNRSGRPPSATRPPVSRDALPGPEERSALDAFATHHISA